MARVDKIKFAEVRDKNTIQTTQWGVTGDRQGYNVIRDRTLVIMYTAKESWILANREYVSIYFSTNCICISLILY
jgi:hypothetical protein